MDFKIFRSILFIFFSLILSACGGSGGGSNNNDIGSPNTVSSSTAPNSFSNTYVSMTIDNMPSGGLGNGFPLINNTLIHQHDDYNLFYLQSDQYGAWQYQGKFEYQKDGNDEADIEVTIDSTGRAYSIHYEFADANSGVWEGKFNDGRLTLNGSFILSPRINPELFDFRGTIEEEQTISSTITNVSYQYQVYLPVGYYESDKDYPVIYITDGQWEYWKVSHSIETSEKDIILVSITQGPQDRRLIDYALPGSTNYLAFLAQEMLPLIESQYRIDATERTLVGYSWGGLLIRHAMINEVTTPLFNTFISVDGSYWHENDAYAALESEAFAEGGLANKQIYLSGATRQGNNGDVQAFYNQLNRYNIPSSSIIFQSYEVEHGQVSVPTIRNALLEFYP